MHIHTQAKYISNYLHISNIERGVLDPENALSIGTYVYRGRSLKPVKG
jgi:hypothetical protein